jgi:hypothetical protein
MEIYFLYYLGMLDGRYVEAGLTQMEADEAVRWDVADRRS